MLLDLLASSVKIESPFHSPLFPVHIRPAYISRYCRKMGGSSVVDLYGFIYILPGFTQVVIA